MLFSIVYLDFIYPFAFITFPPYFNILYSTQISTPGTRRLFGFWIHDQKGSGHLERS